MLGWLGVILAASSLQSAETGESPPRTLLWRDLYAGMTKAEVKALYPKYKSSLSPDCPVRVLSTYEKGRLVSVILLGRDESAPCTAKIFDEYQRQYGEVSGELNTQNAMPIATSNSVSFRSFKRLDYVWNAQGKTVRLSIMPGKPLGYNLIFTTRTDGRLY